MSLPHVAVPRVSDIDWRWALPRVVAVFMVTRLLVLVVAIAVEATQPGPPVDVLADERPLLRSLTVWDGTYYLGIAEEGYHADPSYGPDYAFYPGYPLLVRAASVLTLGDGSVAAVLVGNLAYLLALVVLYALSVRHLRPERAILSLWFLSLAPGAIAFALSYSDSLFLLLAVSAFLATETRHAWLAGIALALATLTRAPGILLGLPLLMLIVERDGLRPSRAWLPLLLAPLVLLGFVAYLWWLTGDPAAPLSAQAYWSPPQVPGAETVIDGAVDPTYRLGNEDFVMRQAPAWASALWIGSLAFTTFLFVFFRHDRIRPAYWVVAILAVATVFLSGRLQSSTRYTAVAWPFDWVLASRESRVGRAVVLGAFAVLHTILLWMAFSWRLAP